MGRGSIIGLLVLRLLWCCQYGQAFIPTNSVTLTETSSILRKKQSSGFVHPIAVPLFAKQPGERKISQKRRDQLGIADDEEEYDLGFALEQNTDPLISKIIAGSLILVIISLLVAGVVIPSLTDYGEGVCSPIQHGGRC